MKLEFSATIARTIVLGALGTSSAAIAAPLTTPQGEFVNYEVGSVHPITLQKFTVGSTTETMAMVCNPGDHSLEFYRTDSGGTGQMALIKSVPTGLSPVTVRFDPVDGMAYTCDHIGDSVTKVSVTATMGDSSLNFNIRLVGTYPVGDEPTDVLIIPAGESESGSVTERVMLVSLRSRSAVAKVDPTDMQVIEDRVLLSVDRAGSYPVGIKHPVSLMRVNGDILALDKHSDHKDTYGSAVLSGGLGLMVQDSDTDKFDLFFARPNSPVAEPDPFASAAGASRTQIKGLGTTHHDMVALVDGRAVLVVGTKAQSQEEDMEPDLRDLPTGFSQSWLWMINMLDPSGPAVMPEVSSSSPAPFSINLNRDYTASGLAEITPTSTRKTVSQPTGVAVYEPMGSFQKVVVTAFSSDNVIVLDPDPTVVGGWDVKTIDLAPINASLYSMAGPRNVAIDNETGLAYVMCALDNSVQVVDITGSVPTLGQRIALDGDLTPTEVALGREFLYGAHHSATGTVSCASCHVDGHTDALTWSLNPADHGTIPANQFAFGAGEYVEAENQQTFPDFKGDMVTQSLRGLVNFPIEGAGQGLATNAPYHWRGDRVDLAAFGVAFNNLLGRAAPFTQAEEVEMTAFVNGIMHSPNPEQDKARVLGGSLGASNSITRNFDPTEGDGALRGMKLFHANSQIGLSCAHCHAMPEGSNNRLTQRVDPEPASGEFSPIEPAALRGIFDFEPLVILEDVPLPPKGVPAEQIELVRVKSEGLFHDGIREKFQSISHFVQHRFDATMPGLGRTAPVPGMSGSVHTFAWNRDTSSDPAVLAAIQAELADLDQFVRKLDTGTAPAIGWTYTLSADFWEDLAALWFITGQVGEANAGAVIHTDEGGVIKSYFYDVAKGLFRRDLAAPAATEDQNMYYFINLAGVAGNAVTVQGVPIGSARRIADREGFNRFDSGLPSSLALLPMAMPTHWKDAGSLEMFWDPANPIDFYASTSGSSVAPRANHLMQLHLQQEVLDAQAASGGSFDTGLTARKHEPPRRFRVMGQGIEYGAVMTLLLPNDTGARVPVEIPIFATSHKVGANRVWESAIEIDAEMQMALLNGGPYIDAVRDNLMLVGGTSSGPVLHATTPAVDNDYQFTVTNPIGFPVSGTPGPLKIQNSRW